MSSPLDLSGKASDDSAPSSHHHHHHHTTQHTKTRRDKRHVLVEDSMLASQESDITPSAPRAMVNYIGDLGFLLFFNLIMLFFGAIARGFSLVFGNIHIFTPAEERKILQEMPAEQRQQQRELEYIHGNQVHQRQELEDLRRRIARIEERRKGRTKQS